MSRRATAEDILSQLELFGIRLGLETTRRLLASFSHPEQRFAPVLVAGTNGKGSTAALLAEMCSAAQYRTGLFTSPHLESVTERLQVNRESVSRGELAELLAEVVERSESVVGRPPTYFEALFVASCLWFARREAEIAVLEVGMGGRLDATNACEPQVSIITRLGMEHQAFLGATVERIAREKAGVLRPGRPAIIGEPDHAVAELLRSLAREVAAVPVMVADSVRVVDRHEYPDWRQSLTLESKRRRYAIDTSLAGEVQQLNIATAVAGAEKLAAMGWSGLENSRAIEEGAERCRWPGRLERVQLPEGGQLILDAAHNPQAAGELARFLAPRLEPCTLVFAVLADKDAESMLRHLEPLAAAWVLTSVGGERGRDPFELAKWVSAPATVTASPAAALDIALRKGRPVVVTGSLYLVGEIRALLGRRDALGLGEPQA